ncbi:MAG: DegV family protein [Clostridia bacterium]|nr:DegV family protein [Clostridia bacterium]
MDKFVILPDVTCDMSQEMREYFGLKDYISGYVHIDGRSIRTKLDWSEISRSEFYKCLSNKKIEVSSAAASPEEYYLAFKKCIEEGYAVLSMSISSTISATYNISVTAANRIKEEFPDAKICCIDTKRMSGSFGLLVAYACEMQANGKSYEEVISWIEENKTKVHQMGPIDDLTFIARRGKISKGKAFMGNLVGIKPMGDSNQEGYVTVLAKVKGIKKAIDATVAYVQKIATDIENQYLFVLHSDREEYANTLKDKLLQAVRCKRIFVSDIHSACGTNIGPGMLGVYFMGDDISEECKVERETLTSIVENLK